MANEILGTNASTIIWDEMIEQLNTSNDTYSISTGGWANINSDNVVTGIDWSSTPPRTVTSTWHSGVIYTPYIPLGVNPCAEINLNGDMLCSLGREKDHFKEEEDLFKI